VTHNDWFRYCRPRWETLTERIVLLKGRKQFVEERIAGLNRQLAHKDQRH
jgi:hypothetical protein